MGSGQSYIKFSDVKAIRAELVAFDKNLRLELLKNARVIAAGTVKDIRKAIPQSAPLPKPKRGGGMTTRIGRLSWGMKIPAKSALVQAKNPRVRSLKRFGEISLARIIVRSPGTVMADMAGKVGKYDKYPRTRKYPYTFTNPRTGEQYVGERSHKNNGQGRALVGKLGGKPSRYVYKAADASLPQVRAEMAKVVEKYSAMVSRKIKVRSSL
jgi:hypothetical protein